MPVTSVTVTMSAMAVSVTMVMLLTFRRCLGMLWWQVYDVVLENFVLFNLLIRLSRILKGWLFVVGVSMFLVSFNNRWQSCRE